MKSKAAVIGAGIGGLASAIRLSLKGYETHLFEKNEVVGGKIGEIHLSGCRFDTGPSLFTLPSLVDELFTLAGEDPRDHFGYLSLPSSCRYFWDDGTKMDAWTDRERFADEAERITGEPGEKVIAFLDECAELYDLTARIFIFSPFYQLDNFRKPESLNVARNFRKLNAFSTMHQVIRKRFASEKLIQLFDRYATYNGSSPYRAPGTLNVIAHLEHNTGAFFPEKGMRDIVEVLTQLASRCRVTIHTATPVLSVIKEGNIVAGVKTAEGIMNADVVVSDSDVIPFYRNLMQEERPARKQERQERSTSALIFYWEMKERYEELDLHNIFFSSDYPEEFRALGRGEVTDDPTVYLFASSRVVASDAPKDRDNWFVMINVPYDSGQDWAAVVERSRRNIINKVSRRLGKDIAEEIAEEAILDPPLIEKLTVSHRGALYGSSSNSRFAAFRRHPNVKNRYGNLWFVGGSVHPGGGIPLCLASAKIACDMIPPAEG
ncbi:MAG: phytoene desaturase family protein [Bacteroidales bacterium]|nr:phytoene desaturase family protein [Bacteroidales bacterium]MDT8374669.1 1-hydroxycarotenoid 3,4-desaturase CrtD [Bacteroidales bacterium]